MDSPSRHIKFDEYYKLDPIGKLNRFGMIPWELIIHLLLLIFTIVQAIVLVGNKNIFISAQEKSFCQLFNNDLNGVDFNSVYYLYSPNELKAHVKRSIDTFFHIKTKTLDIVDYSPDHLNPVIEFNYITINLSSKKLQRNHNVIFNATQYDLGLFDKSNKEIKTALNTLSYFKINYTLITHNRYIWDISHIYDFSSRGYIASYLDVLSKGQINSHYGTNEYGNAKHYFDQNESIHLIVFGLALISFMYTWGDISNISKKYTKMVKKYEILEPEVMMNSSSSCDSSVYFNPYDSDTMILKRELSKPITTQSPKPINKKINRHILQYLKWSLLCFIGNCIQLLGSGIALAKGLSLNTEILLGTGTLLASINIGRYHLLFGNIYSGFYSTLKSSIPLVSRYLLGVFPIIFGLLFFAYCIFYESQRFSSVSQSIITLFSLMEGDSIYVILTDLNSLSGLKGLIGLIFGFIFVILTILIVFNIFIQIIDQSYVIAKLNNKSSWVYKHIHPVQSLPRIASAQSQSQSMPKKTIKRVQSMPKQIPTFVNLKKPKANSFFSKRLLTNKNRELSNAEESYEKKSLNPSLRKREIIDHSMSNRDSIMEDEERSASSHSDKKDTNELKVIYENTVKYNVNHIKNYLNSVNMSLSHMKSITQSAFAKENNKQNQSQLKNIILSDIDGVNKAIMNLKEMLLK